MGLDWAKMQGGDPQFDVLAGKGLAARLFARENRHRHSAAAGHLFQCDSALATERAKGVPYLYPMVVWNLHCSLYSLCFKGENKVVRR